MSAHIDEPLNDLLAYFICPFLSVCEQLFARLGAKQSLGTLGLPLFSSLPSARGGLCAGDVVEVTGGEGSGKSEILLNIAARCVLPRWWGDREIGGREVEVVWMSTDRKFDVIRLVAILEGTVSSELTAGDRGGTAECGSRYSRVPPPGTFGSTVPVKPTTPGVATMDGNSEGDEYRALITSSLSRLHVVYCTSSTELATTLQSLRLVFLRTHPDVCALMLDNVAEFYWVDRAERESLVHGAHVKQSMWVNALRSLIEDHHLVVFSARPFLFAQQTTSCQG